MALRAQKFNGASKDIVLEYNPLRPLEYEISNKASNDVLTPISFGCILDLLLLVRIPTAASQLDG